MGLVVILVVSVVQHRNFGQRRELLFRSNHSTESCCLVVITSHLQSVLGRAGRLLTSTFVTCIFRKYLRVTIWGRPNQSECQGK